MGSFWSKEGQDEENTGKDADRLNNSEQGKIQPLEFSHSTWNLTSKKIKEMEAVGELAIKLINVLAYLNPAHITVQFISSSGVFQEQVDPGLKLLESFWLIQVTEAKESQIQIHPHVQNVIRLDLNSRGEEASIVGILTAAIYKQFGKDEFTDGTRECMSHGLHLFPHQVHHFEATMKENWDAVSRVCYYLTQYGNYDESIDICQQASALYQEKNGAAHESTIQMKWKLAGTFSRMGKLDECLETLEPLLPVAKDALGAEHWLTLNILALKASTHAEMGDAEQAVGIYDEIIRTATGRHGEGDRDVTTRILYYQHCKADALLALKRFDEALKLAQHVDNQRAKLFGPNDARCFYVKSLIGRLHYEKGELEEAAKVWKHVYEGFKSLFGEKNARTIAVKKDFEMVSHNLGIEVQGKSTED